MRPLPPMRFTGASVLVDGTLQRRPIALCEGRITEAPLPAVDMSGYMVLPGIVDLHGTAFERHVAPDPASPFPVAAALASTAREAALNGVTTAWIAQGWSWEGGLRTPDFAEALLAERDTWRAAPRPLDLRIQLRAEIHMTDSRDRLILAIKRHGVDFVLFNDFVPEAHRMLTRTPHKVAAWAESTGRSVETLIRRIEAARKADPEVPRHLLELTRAFDALGVRYGSHGDPDGETRERFRMLGAHIAAFPAATSAAALARAVGDPVLMGASNVVRGGARHANVSALALIAKQKCDALVSDDHYPALAEAAWVIADMGLRPFAEAWEMISTRPAQIMGLADRGSLTPGQRADLVLVNTATREIEATISAGRLAFLSGEAGAKLIAAAQTGRFAAE